jgi:hypothetical protein
MAISDTQKVDLLYKKIAWAATKTDTNPPKEAYNESNPSPLLIRGDTLWQLSASIPATIPAATSSVVQVYKDGTGAWSNTIECTELAVTDNRTWSTQLTNWIDPQFGSTYFVKVYVDAAGSTTPQTTGVALQAAGVNDDQWYFDYQSGILNFIGTNLPASIATGITGKSVFISGARYVGPTGVVNWANGLIIGNVSINGNVIGSINGNLNLTGINSLSSSGNITAGNISGAIYGNSIGATANYSSNLTVGQVSIAGNTITGNTGVSFGSNIYAGNVISMFYGNTIGTTAIYSGNVITGNTIGTNLYGNLVGTSINLSGNINAANFITTGNAFVGNITVTNLAVGQGNIIAGNVLSNFYGNFHTDVIYGNISSVVSIGTDGALQLPIGGIASRPGTARQGAIRFNNSVAVNSIEWYDGVNWNPIQNVITDQQITPDGINNTFALNDPSATAAALIVSVNGTLQRPGVNNSYIVSGGNIVFAEIPQSTDIIDIRYVASATVATLTGLSSEISTTGNLFVGNILTSNGLFWGNGISYFDALQSALFYSNTNVAAYLSSNTVASLSTLTTVGNINAGGNLNVSGNIYSNNFNTSGTGGDITGVNTLFATTVRATTANITGNIITGGNLSVSGTGGDITGVNTLFATTVRATTANVTNAIATNANITTATITTANISVVYSNVTTVSSPNVAVSTTPTVIDYFSSSLYRSAKYMVQSTAGSNIQFNEVYLVQNSSNVMVTSTMMNTAANTGVFSATLVSGNVNLLFTAASANTQLRIQKTQFLI